jgi:membrane protein implicated in regulation of membrane protease activity
VEHTVYLYCAWIGCTLIVVQVGLQLFGLGGDTDTDFHADANVDFDGDGAVEGHGNAFFGVFSFKALSAFTGFFGLTGLSLLGRGYGQGARIVMSSAAGLASMLVVAWLMRGLSRLGQSGTLNLNNAVGQTGAVYLRIPGGRAGTGKVTVEVQGRSIEILAMTEGDELATGARIKVVAVDGDTATVVPA